MHSGISTPAGSSLDESLAVLSRNKDDWAQTSGAERIAILAEIKECLLPVSGKWAETAAHKKGIPHDSPIVGEEWLSGPYAVMGYCNLLMQTLSEVAGNKHLSHFAVRELPNHQLAVKVMPHSIWDHLLLSGVSAEVWMQPGVTRNNLAEHTASGYQAAPGSRKGKVALVLGAGNIAAIAPLDCLHKLFVENQVVILKMNPVNDYLIEFLEPALKPLIDRGALRIVQGDITVGQTLCNHSLVEEIHITGSGAAHDAIVWGVGDEALNNKKGGTPKNNRRITSELGAVCPTIVVPGPWSRADLCFQAEQVATQKLHNSGFNCVACQVLIMPRDWPLKSAFLQRLRETIASSTPRALYYPQVKQRLSAFMAHSVCPNPLPPSTANECLIAPLDAETNRYAETVEAFGPALSVTELAGDDPETFLKAAIDYANRQLYGTLGANLLIHPRTMRQIGRARFDEIIADLRYGCIAINTWTGLGFLSPQTPWGAFPGHTLDDVQSGIGFVHNTLLFDRPQKTVVEAPFKPFPRNLLSLSFSLLPRPPWFITNRRGHVLGRLLTHFQYRPSFAKLPRIFFNALRG